MTACSAIHPSRSASASPASGTAAVMALAAAALWVLATALIASSTAPGERAERVVLAALVVGVPVASGLYAIRSAQTAASGSF